ncbi:MAG: RIP metalloprotease RseP, partial [Planctomycetes bacterium]|nr:RIP metalloprotease RseP [Planctomycetota bacterium]
MDLSNLPQYLMAVLGIGLVIFVHEAGHFLAARWCKVRVHVFSLGFGPRLFGWRRGHTTYQIAAIPLGGYVRMAGDEGAAQGRAPEPWELQAKSVPQRFLIYSGGVLMNVAFGILVFPALYLAGIPSIEPVIGAVEGGSPAWMAGVEPGTRVLEVNGREIYDLDMLPQEVAYNGDAPVELVVVAPGAQAPSTLVLEPEKDERQGIYSIGRVGPTHAQGHPLGIAPDGAAAAAGLRDGDHLLGVVGQPAELAPERQ